MGRLASRFSENGTADKPASQPNHGQYVGSKRSSCKGGHHGTCTGCDCACHLVGKRPANRSVSPERSEWQKPRHSGIRSDNDLSDELEMAHIAALHLQGVSHPEIAAKLGVSMGHLNQSLTVLRRRWANSSIRDIDAAITEELAKIGHLEAQYWAAWDRSQNIEMPLDEINRLRRLYGITVRPVGDPGFLDGVLRCIDRRIKLMGLDAPMKIDIEAKVRLMAEAAGLDPDEAVEEAKHVIAEARAGMVQRLAQAADDG